MPRQSNNMTTTNNNTSTSSTKRDAFIQAVILGLLVLQNGAHSLVMRYSRGILKDPFDPTAAVLCAETVKLIVCILAVKFLKKDTDEPGTSSIVAIIRSSKLMAVPAGIYLIQNSLQYMALQHLDSATFAVLSQFKIFTAAIFSVTMLGRKLGLRRWRALTLLVTGVIVVLLTQHRVLQTMQHNGSSATDVATAQANANAAGQPTAADGAETGYQTPDHSTDNPKLVKLGFEDMHKAKEELRNAFDGAKTDEVVSSAEDSKSFGAYMMGITYVLSLTACSGFAGVYFEKVLKSTAKVSLWARNIQLSVWSLSFGLLRISVMQPELLSPERFFYGFSIWTWATVSIGAIGGILVALVVRYADTIVKGFASSMSIVFITIINSWLFSVPLQPGFIIGAMCVIFSIFNYADV
jgi:UDP-galactose transporter